jgi:A118 family predicted phage portal protein|uniref:Portal protein n=1 Tax=Siphoviridae sp. ctGQT3 TaxID=2825412 RepID=A0A8S5UE85_9CAUD|nr:MAG TPA: portal protein [Siphoviridae sp. ctGQT3]
MIGNLINKVKGWWHKMFDYKKIVNDFGLDMETSESILNAIQTWSKIYNKQEPWIDENTKSLHVARTMCEKVAKAVTIEYKSTCSEPYIDGIYQKLLRKKRKYTEQMLGKSSVFFRPYFNGKDIKVNVVQADKFIPVAFDDDDNLTSYILIDQVVKEDKIYTRLEYNEYKDNKITIKNICYKGFISGVTLSSKISLTEVDKWKNIKDIETIEGVDRLIGGFATMPTENDLDNNSPIGQPIYHNAMELLEEIDNQFSRIIHEYRGTELAIDIDQSICLPDGKGGFKVPKGKDRYFRKWDFEDTKDKSMNIFSPEIRDNPLFNGLNEYLIQVESACHLSHGTLAKPEAIEKTATEMKQSKQDYYVTVSDIQAVLQSAFDDLIYGIYVLCKLYGISVKNNYSVEYNWDDSILVDKETIQKQSQLELSQGIIDRVAYFMTTRDWSEEEAIEYIKKMNERKKLLEPIEKEEEPEM